MEVTLTVEPDTCDGGCIERDDRNGATDGGCSGSAMFEWNSEDGDEEKADAEEGEVAAATARVGVIGGAADAVEYPYDRSFALSTVEADAAELPDVARCCECICMVCCVFECARVCVVEIVSVVGGRNSILSRGSSADMYSFGCTPNN